jgi:hypothetical protein
MKAQQMFQQGRVKISSNHNFPALPPVEICLIILIFCEYEILLKGYFTCS